MKISRHACNRFRQRTGCKSRPQARESIARMLTKAIPVAAKRTQSGRIHLFLDSLLTVDGWVFVVREGVVVTCYFGVGKDEVLPMPPVSATTVSESAVPDCLAGIYSHRGVWEPYSVEQGYRKAPCMIRVKGEVHGPCWPNAGKFVPLDGGSVEFWSEETVKEVAYFFAQEAA